MARPAGHRYSAEPQLRRPRDFLRGALADLGDSWRSAWILFRSSLRARHRRLWLGYLWIVVPGLVTATLCVYFRSRNVFSTQQSLLPFPVHVLSGMFLWQSFVEGVAMPQQQLTAYRHTLSRMAVPHESVLLAGLLDLVLGAGLRTAVLLLALLLVGQSAVTGWLWLPFGTLLVVALGVAIGMLLAPLGLLYDDVGKVVGIGSAFGILLTPVFYTVPARSIFWLNPVTPLIEGVRAFAAGRAPDPYFFAVAFLALGALVAGWLFYRLARPHLATRMEAA